MIYVRQNLVEPRPGQDGSKRVTDTFLAGDQPCSLQVPGLSLDAGLEEKSSGEMRKAVRVKSISPDEPTLTPEVGRSTAQRRLQDESQELN